MKTLKALVVFCPQCQMDDFYTGLGGGFKYFFHSWGRWTHFDDPYSSIGLVQPPPSGVFFMVFGGMWILIQGTVCRTHGTYRTHFLLRPQAEQGISMEEPPRNLLLFPRSPWDSTGWMPLSTSPLFWNYPIWLMQHATSNFMQLETTHDYALGVLDVAVLICVNWCIIPANKFGKPHSPFRFFSPAIPFECFGRCTSKTHGILFLSSLVYHWDNMVIMDHGNAIGGGKGVVVSCGNCCRP